MKRYTVRLRPPKKLTWGDALAAAAILWAVALAFVMFFALVG